MKHMRYIDPMMAWVGVLLASLLMLNSCGYHLAGHGNTVGAIAADVRTVSIVGNAEKNLLVRFRQQLHSDAYSIVTDGDVADPEHHAVVHVNVPAPSFTPSAFSSAGVATQYRMILTGSVDVARQGKTVWQSGNIQRRGDVFVTGGPTSIEASRERLLKDLSKQWLNDAVSRLRSGF